MCTSSQQTQIIRQTDRQTDETDRQTDETGMCVLVVNRHTDRVQYKQSTVTKLTFGGTIPVTLLFTLGLYRDLFLECDPLELVAPLAWTVGDSASPCRSGIGGAVLSVGDRSVTDCCSWEESSEEGLSPAEKQH